MPFWVFINNITIFRENKFNVWDQIQMSRTHWSQSIPNGDGDCKSHNGNVI